MTSDHEQRSEHHKPFPTERRTNAPPLELDTEAREDLFALMRYDDDGGSQHMEGEP
jgi:hypothetical protein